LCISDASPATFETPLDARREDDHPNEEEPDKKLQLEEKDDAFTGQDDKSSQDFEKRNETFRLGRFQVLMASSMKMTAFCSPCSLI
jgi:hypothetical protein